MTEAQAHAALVDEVLSIPIVAQKKAEGADLRVCPNCTALYVDLHTPDSVPYHAQCYGRLNNFAKMNGAYMAAVPIEHAPDEALREIIKQLGAKK